MLKHLQSEVKFMIINPTELNYYDIYQVRTSLLAHYILNNKIPEKFIAIKINFDYCNDRINPQEHVQNIMSIIELIL
jgi:hypothetical protein